MSFLDRFLGAYSSPYGSVEPEHEKQVKNRLQQQIALQLIGSAFSTSPDAFGQGMTALLGAPAMYQDLIDQQAKVSAQRAMQEYRMQKQMRDELRADQRLTNAELNSDQRTRSNDLREQSLDASAKARELKMEGVDSYVAPDGLTLWQKQAVEATARAEGVRAATSQAKSFMTENRLAEDSRLREEDRNRSLELRERGQATTAANKLKKSEDDKMKLASGLTRKYKDDIEMMWMKEHGPADPGKLPISTGAQTMEDWLRADNPSETEATSLLEIDDQFTKASVVELGLMEGYQLENFPESHKQAYENKLLDEKAKQEVEQASQAARVERLGQPDLVGRASPEDEQARVELEAAKQRAEAAGDESFWVRATELFAQHKSWAKVLEIMSNE